MVRSCWTCIVSVVVIIFDEHRKSTPAYSAKRTCIYQNTAIKAAAALVAVGPSTRKTSHRLIRPEDLSQFLTSHIVR